MSAKTGVRAAWPSADEPAEREPQTHVGILADQSRERTADEAPMERLGPHAVVAERPDMGGEVVVPRGSQHRQEVLLALRENLQGELLVPGDRRVAAHVPRLHPGGDDAIPGEIVPAVPPVAAQRLAEHEGPPDQLTQLHQVVIRADPKHLSFPRRGGQDQRQQRTPEHHRALRTPDPAGRIVLVVPEGKEDARYGGVSATDVPHLDVEALREIQAAGQIGMGLRQHLAIARYGPLIRAGEADGSLDVLMNVEMSLDERREEEVVGVEEDDELSSALAEPVQLCPELADVLRKPDVTEASVLPVAEQRPYDGGGSVARAVVDDDALEAIVGLSSNGTQAVGDELAVVVRGDDDGDERVSHPLRECRRYRGWHDAHGQLCTDLSASRHPGAHRSLEASRYEETVGTLPQARRSLPDP